MQNERIVEFERSAGRIFGLAARVMLGASLAVTMTGCTLTLAPLAKDTATFSKATGTVVDSSKGAYAAANQLHNQAQVVVAIDNYGKPGWRPDTPLKALLTPEQLAARTKVLDALKAYAQALDGLTETTKRNKKLDAAATSAGSNLGSLTAAGAPDLQTVFPGFKGLSASESSGVSTAIVGLGELLINSRSKKALAQTTADMDPNVQALCILIENDATTLRTQADVDYTSAIGSENQFIDHNTIDPGVRRLEIARLIRLSQQQQGNDALLVKLQAAVMALGKAHAALRDAAAGKDPATIKQALQELISLGTELGSYYSKTEAADADSTTTTSE